MVSFRTIFKLQRLIPLSLLSALLSLKLFFLVTMIRKSNYFLEPDFVAYYTPISEHFITVYLQNTSQSYTLEKLSAQVTPLFPLVVWILRTNAGLLIFLFICSLVITLLTYIIAKELFGVTSAIWATIFVCLEPAFFTSSLNLAPEILFSLFLILGVYFYILHLKKNSSIHLLLCSLLIGLSVLVRPIGLIPILGLVCWLILQKKNFSKKGKWWSIILLLLPSAAWSLRNLIWHGIFTVSTISSSNLTMYEGVAAKALANKVDLREAQLLEETKIIAKFGETPDLIDLNSYYVQRGLSLIVEYPIAFLQTHIVGSFKLMFGISETKFKLWLSELYGVHQTSVLVWVAIFMIVSLIWLLFFYKLIALSSSEGSRIMPILIIIFALLVSSSGVIGYSRFRAPVVPLLCILAGSGVVLLTSRALKLFRKDMNIFKSSNMNV
jgi:4-amino-4-deoxy-L-arabinose transferase-like glycosyltransferase